jgi:hypothetical protein
MQIMEFKNDGSFIKLILSLLRFQLSDGVLVDFSVIVHLRIESVSVLACYVDGVQNRIWIPTFSIPVISVLLISAGLSIEFIGLNIFVGLSFSGVSILLGTQIGGFGGAYPFRWLHRKIVTTQPG